MPKRRAVVLGGIATVFAPSVIFAKAQPSTKVDFEVPPGACDCHTHIHGDLREFPMSPRRVYTPEPAFPEEMAALHRSLGIQRVVIVTPSTYGTDNAATLWGMKARGADARGVAVIDERTPEAGLDSMTRAGVRGVRINLNTGGNNDPAVARQRFEKTVELISSRGWHVQLNTNLAVISAIRDSIAASPIPAVIDHFGNARAALGVDQPGFKDLLDLVRSGNAYVKISAAHRASKLAPDYADVIPLARALIEANPQRLVWGSDWPHTNSAPMPGYGPLDMRPYSKVDDAAILNLLPSWAPDPAIRKMILVDNPAMLYKF